jgi:hypothetical protein
MQFRPRNEAKNFDTIAAKIGENLDAKEKALDPVSI